MENFEVGNNNNGDVHISHLSINQSNFLPCKNCGIRFLSLKQYKVYPNCNTCIKKKRQKNQRVIHRIGICIAGMLSIVKFIEVSSMKVLPVFLLPYVIELKKSMYFIPQSTVMFLIHLFSMFLMVLLTFFIIACGFQIIVLVDNRYKFPYH